MSLTRSQEWQLMVSVQLFMAHNSDTSPQVFNQDLYEALLSQCNFSWHIILIYFF